MGTLDRGRSRQMSLAAMILAQLAASNQSMASIESQGLTGPRNSISQKKRRKLNRQIGIYPKRH